MGIGDSTFHARDHVAVGIIGIALASAEGGHGMFVGRVAVRVGRGVPGGDVANGIVVIVVAVGSTDRIQPVQLVIAEGQRFTARRIHDLADVAAQPLGGGPETTAEQIITKYCANLQIYIPENIWNGHENYHFLFSLRRANIWPLI